MFGLHRSGDPVTTSVFGEITAIILFLEGLQIETLIMFDLDKFLFKFVNFLWIST